MTKKLIYEYFGSTEKLIDEYVKTQDYWSRMNQNNIEVDVSDGGKELSKVAILNQYEFIKKNKELQKIILWGLSESKPILKRIADEREQMGELLFSNIVDPHFKEKSTRYRAIAAILVSGAYYLNLYTAHNASTFCGIDLKSDEGRHEIEKAIAEIIDFAYEEK
ncbi:TetR/AcrR family transcriptional regulator [Chryseobacterium sp. POE27]|uniref:TetR/AcrR family transcriptional regulator n=1 Tax=Chryseobacterium sp. POE27 TaxID=3138177 RepID=UPI00321901CB